MAKGSEAVGWGSRGPGLSTFIFTMTLHAHMYHYAGALLPQSGIQPAFLSIYMHDIDLVYQKNMRGIAMARLRCGIKQQLTAILHDVNPSVQIFASLRKWATPKLAPNNCRMIIHDGHCSLSKRIHHYNLLSTSEVTAIVAVAEDEIVRQRYIFLLCRGVQKSAGHDVLDKVPVILCSYYCQSYNILVFD